MKRALLLLYGLLCCASMMSYGTAQEVTITDLSRIKPLPYVVNMEPLAGKTLLLKSVTCQAAGKPVTQGRLYLTRLPGNRIRTARIEYNEQGKYVLEHSTSSEKAYKYFTQYVTQQQQFSVYTLNALVGMWRLFGLRFSLEGVTYRCTLG